MKKKLQYTLSVMLIMVASSLQAQVGIGTISPNAQLTIDSGSLDIAPLELTPMAAVPTTDLSGGQLVVVDNELYFYDASRSHWFSVSTMQLAYARNGDITAQNLYYGGRVASNNSGAVMPFDGTIVHITAIASGGNATKRFEVRVRNGGVNQSVNDFNLAGSSYTNGAADIDFSAGDNINVRARDDGNGDVTNPAVILWIKWRQ